MYGIFDYNNMITDNQRQKQNINRIMELQYSYTRLMYNFYINRSVPSLYFLNKGIYDTIPNVVLMPDQSWRYDPQYITAEIDKNSIINIFGKLDYITIMKIVITIVSMLFGYSLICGDKENGTLKMIMMNQISRFKVVMSKYIGGLIPLIIFYTLAIILSMIFAEFMISGIFFTNAREIILLFTLGMSLIITYYSISFAVSTITHSSRTSMALCVLLWVFLNIVIPISVAQASKIAVPGGSASDMRREIVELIIEGRRGLMEELARRTNELYQSGLEWEEAQRLASEAADEYSTRQAEHARGFVDDYNNRLNRAYAMLRSLSVITPTAAYTLTSSSISRTGYMEYKRFRDQVRIYEIIIREYLQGKIMEELNSPHRGTRIRTITEEDGRKRAVVDYGDSGRRLDISDMPRFQYAGKDIGQIMSDVLLAVISFLLWTGGSIFLAWYRFRTYDIR